MELSQGKIGSAGKYDLSFQEGKLLVSIEEQDAMGTTKLERSLDAGAVIDALAKAIPGTVDDAIFGVIKAALLPKPADAAPAPQA